MIAANKQDLQHRSVSEEEAQEFAASQGAAYFQTSAKTGLGLEELFNSLLTSVLDSLKDQRQHAAQGTRSTRNVSSALSHALLELEYYTHESWKGAAYFSTSAKTGVGLEELFNFLSTSVLDSLKDQQQHAAEGRRSYFELLQ